MSDFSFSLQRLLNNPLMCTPKHAAMVVAAVQDRLGLTSLRMPDQESGGTRVLSEADMQILAGEGRASAEQSRMQRKARVKNYEQAGNIAIVPVWGSLTKNTGSMDPSSGMTGYNRIEQKIAEAQQDPNIAGIWLDIDSGGGEAGGMHGLADYIYRNSARFGGKPIWSCAAAYAYSAAFGIMTSGDRTFCSVDGGCGSVGVLMLYVNAEKFYGKQGIEITVMRSGADKARLNQFETPDDKVLAHVQQQLDDLRDVFVSLVARNRLAAIAPANGERKNSRILAAEKTVRETEGLDYMGPRARAIGFVDEVCSEQAAFESFVRFLNR